MDHYKSSIKANISNVMWDGIIIHILVHNNSQMVHTSLHAINHSRFHFENSKHLICQAESLNA